MCMIYYRFERLPNTSLTLPSSRATTIGKDVNGGYYHRPFSFADVIPLLVMGVRQRPLVAINDTSLCLVLPAGLEPALPKENGF